jgi:hypothetical protein
MSKVITTDTEKGLTMETITQQTTTAQGKPLTVNTPRILEGGDSTNETPLKDLFNEYRNYCIESGFKACSLRTLADRLRNSGYQTERKNYGTVVNAEKKVCF